MSSVGSKPIVACRVTLDVAVRQVLDHLDAELLDADPLAFTWSPVQGCQSAAIKSGNEPGCWRADKADRLAV